MDELINLMKRLKEEKKTIRFTVSIANLDSKVLFHAPLNYVDDVYEESHRSTVTYLNDKFEKVGHAIDIPREDESHKNTILQNLIEDSNLIDNTEYIILESKFSYFYTREIEESTYNAEDISINIVQLHETFKKRLKSFKETLNC